MSPIDPREDGPFDWRREDGLTISTRAERLNLPRVHGWLAGSYWAQDIPLSVLERALRHSLAFGAYAPDGRQLAIARVVTDRATYAYLCDVWVDASVRGTGIGTYLMACIVACPALQGLRRFALFTRDAAPLYAKFGFGAATAPSSYMERRDPEVYRIARDDAGFPR
jgi:GNAT superfamily N-acetyltransferase